MKSMSLQREEMRSARRMILSLTNDGMADAEFRQQAQDALFTILGLTHDLATELEAIRHDPHGARS
jgi:hypothetical protein